MLGMASLFAAAAVIITFDAWRDILRLALRDEELSYLLLAPVVIGWLAWVRRDKLRECGPGGEWIGIVVMVFGWAVFRYGYLTDPVIWRAGAVIMTVGAFLAGVGRSALVKFAPAVAACVFLIPVDPTGRYHVAMPLEQATAQVTQNLSELLGMAVTRSGNLLQINGMDVTVAEACNGMRMILTLFMVCYVVAFTLPLPALIRGLLLVASPLVAIVANVIRLVPTLWMFGNRSHEAAERFHDLSGWAMTILAFFLLMGFSSLLQRLLSDPPPPSGKQLA
jgi:exosortase